MKVLNEIVFFSRYSKPSPGNAKSPVFLSNNYVKFLNKPKGSVLVVSPYPRSPGRYSFTHIDPSSHTFSMFSCGLVLLGTTKEFMFFAALESFHKKGEYGIGGTRREDIEITFLLDEKGHPNYAILHFLKSNLKRVFFVDESQDSEATLSELCLNPGLAEGRDRFLRDDLNDAFFNLREDMIKSLFTTRLAQRIETGSQDQIDIDRLTCLLNSIYKDKHNDDEALKTLRTSAVAALQTKRKEYLSMSTLLAIKAIRIDPHCYEHWNILAYSLMKANKLRWAKESSRKALENQPNDYLSMDTLANILYRAGKTEEALSLFQKVCTHAPNVVELPDELKGHFTIKEKKKPSSDDHKHPGFDMNSKYAGTFAKDQAGLSDQFIDDVLDGEPSAYWNID